MLPLSHYFSPLIFLFSYAGQVIMCGLLKVRVDARWRLLATRMIALVPCLSLAVVFEATNTFDKVAQVINIVQSLVLPFGLIPVIHATANQKLMGNPWVSSKIVIAITSFVTFIIVGINVFTLVTLLMDLPAMLTHGPEQSGAIFGFSMLILVYLSLVVYFALGPERWPAILMRVRSQGQMVQNLFQHRRFDCESMLEVH